ncbi:MTH938/NDUFAF3 family protein [Mangrovibacterium lignilyticum]|uniref:MTH938/NDUFAF3 family protein n=1 Tax=Mangrovibacterium lignilyticum TaxID=2668052 RepID=UPI0013CF67B1|nr:MTH938/NDUFAF3 family protein [Mangrovibacterium lignilyticum]
MLPQIEKTQFGNITVGGKRYEYDILIRLDGHIEKRKKKLSKAKYGTSHKISLDEAVQIYEEGAQELIIGTGQIGYIELSTEAEIFFEEKGCAVKLVSTPTAVKVWNVLEGKVIAMFHVTC